MKHLIDAFKSAAEFAERQEEVQRANDAHAAGYYYGQRLAYADAASKLQAAVRASENDLETLRTALGLIEKRLTGGRKDG